MSLVVAVAVVAVLVVVVGLLRPRPTLPVSESADDNLKAIAEYERVGRLMEAMVLAKLGIKRYPPAIQFRLALARVYMARHRESKAERVLRELLTLAPGNTEAEAMLGRLGRRWVRSTPSRRRTSTCPRRDAGRIHGLDHHLRQLALRQAHLDDHRRRVQAAQAVVDLQPHDRAAVDQRRAALQRPGRPVPGVQGGEQLGELAVHGGQVAGGHAAATAEGSGASRG